VTNYKTLMLLQSTYVQKTLIPPPNEKRYEIEWNLITFKNLKYSSVYTVCKV